jgi:hypothetical protein
MNERRVADSWAPRCGWVEQLGRTWRRVQWAEPGSGPEGVFSLFYLFLLFSFPSQRLLFKFKFLF